MKKLPSIVYFTFMAALVFVLTASGCGSSDNDSSSSSSTPTASTNRKIMAVSSPALVKGESYKIYKNAIVRGTSPDVAMYYVAPVTSAENVITMNLEFTEAFSNDAFVIVRSSDNKAIFGYNPDGSGQDTSTQPAAGGMMYLAQTGGGGMKLQKYSNLNVTGAAIDIETSDEIVISLDASSTTATLSGASTGSVPAIDFVWHVSPDHADEYWTLGNGTTEYDEDEMLSMVQSNDGVYIARDIRYTPNTLNFVTTQTASKDEDTEYVVYYDSSADKVSSEISKYTSTNGNLFAGPYILACLPTQIAGQAGQGGPGNLPGGNGEMSGIPSRDQGIIPPSSQSGNGTETPRMQVQSVAGTSIAAYSTMTHSAGEAYANPVLHITRPGTYRLKGTWTGQIWIDANDGKSSSDQVAVILDTVTVSCSVAPAIVFHNVYECGPEADIVSFDVGSSLNNTTGTNTGAIVIIADGSTNSFTGANVYRIMKLKPKDSATKVNGTDISDQKKMYKMDGAFYSFVSMVIGSETGSNSGTLNITSRTFEGLDAELHMLIDSGTVNVTAPDDGINVNEDDTSVFTMDGGTLTINSSGGDGIDSNGWVVIKGGTLNISAGSQQYNSNGEAGIDAEKGYYVSPNATFNWQQASNTFNPNQPGQENNGTTGENSGTSSDDVSLKKDITTVTDYSGNTVMTITFGTPVSSDETNERPNNFPTTSTIFTLYNKVNNFGGVQNN